MKKIFVRRVTCLLFGCSLFFFTNGMAQDVMGVMKTNSRISNFVNALENAQLTDKLNERGPYTVFAPSNDTFNMSATQKANRSYLLNYIMTGMATERNLRAMSNITTLGGKVLSLSKSESGNILIEDRQLIKSNIKASNGVIHIIDGTF